MILPRLPPSLTPRALVAASASLVRFEIMRCSSSATIAMIPTVSRLACCSHFGLKLSRSSGLRAVDIRGLDSPRPATHLLRQLRHLRQFLLKTPEVSQAVTKL